MANWAVMPQVLNVNNGYLIMKRKTAMNDIQNIELLLQQSINIAAEKTAIFFKTGAGSYAEHDQFMGITVPTTRAIAKKFSHISLQEIQTLLQSPINEKRALALFIL